MAIQQINNETKEKIKRKTAYGFPNKPSASGIPPEVIKKTSYAPLVDDENSIVAEINRLVDEANAEISDVGVSLTTLDEKFSEHTTGENSHTKSQVGLGNVDNEKQIPMSYLDDDEYLGGENASDKKVPTQKAVFLRTKDFVSNVQSDWNENNSLEPAYIKNKPQYDAIPTADSGNLVKSGGIKAGTLEDIASHNVNEDAHEAIRDTVAEVRKIAEGSHVAIAFDDEAQLTAWINGEFTREDGKVVGDLIFGQNIYLRALNEPDYWVSELPVSSISDLTKLPTEKIDLSDYDEAIKVIWGLA